MQEIYVQNSAAIQSKISQLTQYNSQLQTKINELNNLEVRANAAWDGEANDEFHRVFQKDKQMFDQFHTAIAEYIKALQKILQEYESAERKNVQIAKTRK